MLILLGSVSLAVAAASIPVAPVTWLVVRWLATKLREDAVLPHDAETRIAARAAPWVLGAATLQIASGLTGSPAVFGIIAAIGAAWLFSRARPHPSVALGVSLAGIVALSGLGVQSFWWGIHRDGQQRAAVPRSGDAGALGAA